MRRSSSLLPAVGLILLAWWALRLAVVVAVVAVVVGVALLALLLFGIAKLTGGLAQQPRAIGADRHVGGGRMQQDDFRAGVLDRLWRNAQAPRSAIFGAADPRPTVELEHLGDMWPGFVGDRYRPGGLVLLAHFPAGGTSAYENTGRASRDQQFYRLIRAFKSAEPTERGAAFDALNTYCAGAIPVWKMFKIISVVLDGAGVSLDEVALLNLVPYRTGENAKPSARTVDAAWRLCTQPALAALQPGIVAALGSAVRDGVQGRSLGEAQLFSFRRTIGDSYVHPEALSEVNRLASHLGRVPGTSSASSQQATPREITSAPRAGTLRTGTQGAITAGPATPSRDSVHGKIRAAVIANPGKTEQELLPLLRRIDFSGNPTPHAGPGGVSDAWLRGYLQGGVRRGYLQRK